MGNAQTAYTEIFEDVTYLYGSGWKLYNSTNMPYGTYFSLFSNAWEVVSWSAESGNTVVTSLEFFARAHDVSPYNDSFILKISTTTTAKASFSNVLAVAQEVNSPISDLSPYQVNFISLCRTNGLSGLGK